MLLYEFGNHPWGYGFLKITRWSSRQRFFAAVVETNPAEWVSITPEDRWLLDPRNDFEKTISMGVLSFPREVKKYFDVAFEKPKTYGRDQFFHLRHHPFRGAHVIASYALIFCRCVIGIAFAWSFVGKLRDVASFVMAIERFRLLPKVLHEAAAWGFLAGELAVVLAMLIGGPFLSWGFLWAGLMLLAFCGALAAVLWRKIDTSCNCFGSSQKPVSPWDLVRNAGLIACVLAGLALAPFASLSPGYLESGLMFVAALVFVPVWVQVEEIVAVLR